VKRFKETRILGSANVGLVYLYVNVPTYSTLNSRASLVEHFRKAHADDLKPPASDDERRKDRKRLGKPARAPEGKSSRPGRTASAGECGARIGSTGRQRPIPTWS
jgi:hypothetical protein